MMRSMEERLCEAAIRGSVELLEEIIGEDGLILDKIAVGCSKVGRSPLCVAASCGQTLFVEQLLLRKPELAKVVDKRHGSALHLASANGHVETVVALVRARPEMCLSRDQDGRNPLHVAAVMGHVAVLEELVQASPHAARFMVDQDGSILHLCLKYNQLMTLKRLLQLMRDVVLINAKDSGGNTILHLSVSSNQFQVVGCVLENKIIDVNAKNSTGHTAMDIAMLAKDGMDKNITELLIQAGGRTTKSPSDELQNTYGNTIMILASVVMAMTFQAVISPPGGVWQDTSDTHMAGEAVMAHRNQELFQDFQYHNAIGFFNSLMVFVLLASGLVHRTGFGFTMLFWVIAFAMFSSYAKAFLLITPKGAKFQRILAIIIEAFKWGGISMSIGGHFLANKMRRRYYAMGGRANGNV